ncbi:hypothetical protein J2803_005123 [Paraburkholderia phenoliruptrix]|nr:hypothetical protein [Paraburkholderia phenoliruptrix]
MYQRHNRETRIGIAIAALDALEYLNGLPGAV